MIVTQEEYERMRISIVKTIHEGERIKTSECYNTGLDLEAMTSLHSQMLVRLLRTDLKKVDSNVLTKTILSKLQVLNSNNDYDKKERQSLLSLSHELGVSSYRTAKIVVESLLGKNISVSQVVENPLLIIDEWTRENVFECIVNDPLCSLECDQLKECTGKEYEALLLQQLQSKNMCFETEAELRNKGKPKTPDILFLIPMGVYESLPLPKFESNLDETESNNISNQHQSDQQYQQQLPFVINWIDSKGMFADEETFEENYEQLKSYVNRY